MRTSTLVDRKVLADVMSVESVSESTDFSRAWIREQLRTGRLRGRKLGGRWVILRTALLEFLRADPILRVLPPRSSDRMEGGES